MPSRVHCEGCMGMILKASMMSALESQAPCPASFIHFRALSTVFLFFIYFVFLIIFLIYLFF